MLTDEARKAVAALDLDFAAVDMGWQDGTPEGPLVVDGERVIAMKHSDPSGEYTFPRK